MTAKSSKNYIVLSAATILYVANLIESLMEWQDIIFLIGTSGESKSQSLLQASAAFSNNIALDDITKFLPFIVANGLLVRYLSLLHNFDFF